jgi:hypothetical protein
LPSIKQTIFTLSLILEYSILLSYHDNMDVKIIKPKKAVKVNKKVIADVNLKFSHEPFKKNVLKLRLLYKIPAEGYGKEVTRVWDPSFTNILKLPKEWPYYGNKKKFKNLLKGLDKIRNDFHLVYDFWIILLTEHLFFNKVDPTLIESMADNLCIITSVKSEENMFIEFSPRIRKKYLYEHNKKMNEWFPISIKISPYASVNEIISYIRSRKVSIKREQVGYKKSEVSLGSTKTRTTYVRNKFIMEHEKLSRKKISELLLKELGVKYDEFEINKIISDIKKNM